MKYIKPTPGPCIWCGEHVTDESEASTGFATPHQPDWAIDGDYGCNEAPNTDEEGTGSHARPSDAAQWFALHEAMLEVIVSHSRFNDLHAERRLERIEESIGALASKIEYVEKGTQP